MTTKIFSKSGHGSEIAMGAVLLLVVAMLLLPMPAFAIDLMLVLNISFSLIVLLVTLYIKDSVEFSVFPSMLLMLTLFRLGLNIATSRVILTSGTGAGAVINAFGNFVVGGNYVVGVVIFIILIIIQFIVITNGSQRVAEVAARFTLDAMPGKQMSIDADLNAGLITEDQARARRLAIEKEADFYGSMDGAARFIRGDSIAAIIIIVVNIIGGFIVGVAQQHMSMPEALRTFTLLTIGAGIAMQIPSLLVSTGTGVIVSRQSSEEDLGKDLIGQLFREPKALAIAAGLLAMLIFIPALPKLPFIVIAASIAGIAYVVKSAAIKTEEESIRKEEKEALLKRKPENVIGLLKVDPIELEIGYGLIPLVNPEQGGTLLDRVTLIRRQLALDLGIVVPPVRIRDNIQLAANEYVIKIKGIEASRKEVQINHYLAIDPGKAKEKIEGIAGVEPVFNLPGVWISELQRRKAETAGYTVVDIATVVSTHLSEIVKNNSPEILTRQDVQQLMDNLKKEYAAIVEELVPNLMTIGEIQKVLKNLLKEKVPVRDLVTICEILADQAHVNKNIDFLTEASRAALGSHICKQYIAQDKVLYVISLSQSLEQTLIERIGLQAEGQDLGFEPDFVKKVMEGFSKAMTVVLTKGYQPVVLVSPQVRLIVRRLTDRTFPQLAVLSYKEINVNQDVRILGKVELNS